MGTTRATRWRNGTVFTGRRWVDALLAVDGRIEVAGSEEEVARSSPTGTETVDLAGGWLLPGLIDPHFHLAGTIVARASTDLRHARSLAELRSAVESSARDRPPGTPMIGRGWDDSRLAEHRPPTLGELDAWNVEAPLVLYRVCGHVAVANSRALSEAGVTDASPDPSGGTLGRTRGALDGRLFEAALGLVRPLGARAFLGLKDRIPGFLRELAGTGLTTIAPMSSDAEELETVLAAAPEAKLPLRLRPYFRFDRLEEARRWTDGHGPKVALGGIKIVADGSLGARTAWLDEPYSDSPTQSGGGRHTDGELAERIEEVSAAGLPVAVHAIGDAAVQQFVRCLRDRPPRTGARIEHASVTPPAVIRALASVRPTVVVQPHFVVSDTWLLERLGADRARWTYAFRSLAGAGLTLAGSSDSPVERADPWSGIRAATASRRWGPTERLTPPEALGLYTTGAAAALRAPELGLLEPGRPADLLWTAAGDWANVLAAGATGVRGVWSDGVPTSDARDAGTGPQRR